MARILLVEDQFITGRMVETILISAEHQVAWCRDGQSGLASFTATQPDIVITDILMPEIDGIELIKSIRRMGFATPVIALSAGGPLQDYSCLEEARTVGANVSIRKPVTREELLAAIDQCLEVASSSAL